MNGLGVLLGADYERVPLPRLTSGSHIKATAAAEDGDESRTRMLAIGVASSFLSGPVLFCSILPLLCKDHVQFSWLTV
jgi:hypothetical protein